MVPAIVLIFYVMYLKVFSIVPHSIVGVQKCQFKVTTQAIIFILPFYYNKETCD